MGRTRRCRNRHTKEDEVQGACRDRYHQPSSSSSSMGESGNHHRTPLSPSQVQNSQPKRQKTDRALAYSRRFLPQIAAAKPEPIPQRVVSLGPEDVLPDIDGEQRDNLTVQVVGGAICPQCGPVRTKHLRKHIDVAHLPWFLSPDSCCFSCCQAVSSPGRLKLEHTKPSCLLLGQNGTLSSGWCCLMSGAIEIGCREL